MRTLPKLALALALLLPALAGCSAADQRLAVGAGNAAACGWLAATGASCAGGSAQRLEALSRAQREEVGLIYERAARVDRETADKALAALEAGAASLRAVTEALMALERKAAPAAPQGPATAPPPATGTVFPTHPAGPPPP